MRSWQVSNSGFITKCLHTVTRTDTTRSVNTGSFHTFIAQSTVNSTTSCKMMTFQPCTQRCHGAAPSRAERQLPPFCCNLKYSPDPLDAFTWAFCREKVKKAAHRVPGRVLVINLSVRDKTSKTKHQQSVPPKQQFTSRLLSEPSQFARQYLFHLQLK